MYQPAPYQLSDRQNQITFIKKHPFATLVIQGVNLLATHIPVLVESRVAENNGLRLFGHIANHNNMLPFLDDRKEVLTVFQGVQGYISSSWYEHEDISTWNYQAVHVNGIIKRQTEAELRLCLSQLVNRFESEQPSPLLYEHLSEKIINEHIHRITGFWIEPLQVSGINKMSQTLSQSDFDSTLAHLKKQSETSPDEQTGLDNQMENCLYSSLYHEIKKQQKQIGYAAGTHNQ